MGVLGAAIISLATGLLAYELSARVPKLSRWLIEVSVRQLPLQLQDRYREEWLAHYHDMPNSLARLSHALTLLITGAATEIAGDQLEQQMITIETGLSALKHSVTRQRDKVVVLNQKIQDFEREGRLGIAARKSLRQISEMFENSGLPVYITKPMHQSVEKYFSDLESVSGMSQGLLKTRAIFLRQKTEEIVSELALAEAAYDRANRIRKTKRKAGFADAMAEILLHLEAAERVQPPGQEYEALVEESDRLCKAFKRASESGPDFPALP